MAEQLGGYFRETFEGLRRGLADGLRVIRRKGPSEVQFWFIALLIGVAAAFAALLFRIGVGELQALLYGTDNVAHIHQEAARIKWYWLLAIPMFGGLAVGTLLHIFTSDGRVRAVADVIEGAALREGRVGRRAGLASALASFLTLSTGGSSGREGPVVHLAAVMATYVSRWIHADGVHGRTLMGCAVAGAVSASFNAPIAGGLFALEVVLRHYAVNAFAPIAIASVAGTVVSRLVMGDVTEFYLSPNTELGFYAELPAFVVLGLFAGLVAATLMKSIFWAEGFGDVVQERFGIHRILRPVIAGAILGGMAIWWPHIIGVGWGVTSEAVTGRILFMQAVIFVVVKIIAVAVTIGGRMGGGVFSPSLMVGALAGLAFGIVATNLFPEGSSPATLYALAGMGAVAAAVLGAPISTTLIIFELTGDWQTGLAVMVAVSLSTALASRLVDRSFFLTQLERRGIHLAAGPQTYLLGKVRVTSVMRAIGTVRAPSEETCWEMIREGRYIDASDTLRQALPDFEETGQDFLPVVRIRGEDRSPDLLGALYHVDALRAYNRALAEKAREEHS